VSEAFDKLPAVMARADALGGRIQRAAVDLAESVILHGREGQMFAAIVTEVDSKGARIQLCDFPVVARIGDSQIGAGRTLNVTLIQADPDLRTVTFRPAPPG
jgi:exoribonuclease R